MTNDFKKHPFSAIIRGNMHIHPKTVFVAVSRRLRRHRLLVVLPLFAVMAGLTVREMALSQALITSHEPRVIAAADTTNDVILDDGTILRLQPFAGVVIDGDAVLLERGSVIVAARGIAHITAGETTMSLFSGTAHITYQEQSLTAAAISAPLSVQSPDAFVIVPTGMQWTKGAVMPLPEIFLRDVRGSANDLMNRDLQVSFDDDAIDASAWSLLRLDAAKERMTEAEKQAKLSALNAALVSGDTQTLHAMLLEPQFADFLREDIVQPRLPLLVYLAMEQGVLEAFVAAFLAAPESWVLSALHPAMRDHAWTTTIPAAVSDAERLAILLALPRADTMSEEVVSLTTERWGLAWAEYLERQEDPLNTLVQALPVLREHIAYLHESGYPLRVRQYVAAIEGFAGPYKERLSVEAHDALRQMQELSDPSASLESVEIETDPEESAVAESPVTEVSAMSADEALAVARALLGEQGFMFTANTVLGYRAPAFVDITGIVLGTAKGDRLLSFTLDVQSGEVAGIIVEGKVSPYGMPLASYTEWVRSGE